VRRLVGGDAPNPVAGEELGRQSPPRLILEVNAGERLTVGVADDVAGVCFLDGPRRREAACLHVLSPRACATTVAR
jgi:hypothetical protein